MSCFNGYSELAAFSSHHLRSVGWHLPPTATTMITGRYNRPASESAASTAQGRTCESALSCLVLPATKISSYGRTAQLSRTRRCGGDSSSLKFNGNGADGNVAKEWYTMDIRLSHFLNKTILLTNYDFRFSTVDVQLPTSQFF